MTRRAAIVAGVAAGVAWTVAVLWAGVTGPFASLQLVSSLALGGLLAGTALAAMIATLARHRFLTDEVVDGQPYRPGSMAAIDQRVLTNTVEQVALAVCVWPAASVLVAPGLAAALGAGFLVARAAFWIGYRRAPHLRAFGFAATFYPTVAAGLWAAWSALE